MLRKPDALQLDALLAAVDDLKRAEASVTALRQVVAAKAQGLSEIKDKRLRIEAGFYAYWMALEASPMDIAMGATGRPHPGKMLKAAGALLLGFSCDRCQAEIAVRSRNHFKTMSEGQPWAEGYRLLCIRCQDEVHDERLRKSNAEYAAERERTRHLQALSYDAYLKTADWSRQRDRFLDFRIVDRRELTCEVCPAADDLGLYHRSLDGLGAHDDLMVLCQACVGPLAAAGRIAGAPTAANRLSPAEITAFAAEAAASPAGG